MYNGVINIYKEKGYTSHDVVAVLRKILGQKKIGHTGTLDPEATGVLPICLGKGTKIAEWLVEKEKVYITTFKLGAETDTQDHTGKIIQTLPVKIDEAQLKAIIHTYLGDIDQLPPMYSAVKINGKKLYELARAGEIITRPKRSVHIFAIEKIKIELPYVHMMVTCSKGTYIRTLCRDIAESAGTCGHMTALERVRSGVFKKETALTLSEVQDQIDSDKINGVILPIDTLFSYEKISIHPNFNHLLYNGNRLPLSAIINQETTWVDGTKIHVYDYEKNYMGIYLWLAEKKMLKPIKFLKILP